MRPPVVRPSVLLVTRAGKAPACSVCVNPRGARGSCSGAGRGGGRGARQAGMWTAESVLVGDPRGSVLTRLSGHMGVPLWPLRSERQAGRHSVGGQCVGTASSRCRQSHSPLGSSFPWLQSSHGGGARQTDLRKVPRVRSARRACPARGRWAGGAGLPLRKRALPAPPARSTSPASTRQGRTGPGERRPSSRLGPSWAWTAPSSVQGEGGALC